MLPSAAKLSTLNTWSCKGDEPIIFSSCLAVGSWKASPTCGREAAEDEKSSSFAAWVRCRLRVGES